MRYRSAVLFGLLIAALTARACGGSTEPGSSGTGGNDGSAGSGGTGGTHYADCNRNSDCVIRPASCCGQCGAATRQDIVALNQSMVSAYNQANCGDGFGCPACYMAQDANLVATCEAGQCKVVDLLTNAATTCATSADCRVRTNVCCECGGPTTAEHMIAINASSASSYASIVCDPDTACDECLPLYPPDVIATCSEAHCQAAWAK